MPERLQLVLLLQLHRFDCTSSFLYCCSYICLLFLSCHGSLPATRQNNYNQYAQVNTEVCCCRSFHVSLFLSRLAGKCKIVHKIFQCDLPLDNTNTAVCVYRSFELFRLIALLESDCSVVDLLDSQEERRPEIIWPAFGMFLVTQQTKGHISHRRRFSLSLVIGLNPSQRFQRMICSYA